MDQVLPWQRLCDLITPFRPAAFTGRKAKETELMLRISCLQQWYGLSDPGVEDTIKERLFFQRFPRLDPFTGTVSDETTMFNYRHLLEEHDLQEAIFESINEHLEGQGLLMPKQGRPKILPSQSELSIKSSNGSELCD